MTMWIAFDETTSVGLIGTIGSGATVTQVRQCAASDNCASDSLIGGYKWMWCEQANSVKRQ
jgi:hypothetical protein